MAGAITITGVKSFKNQSGDLTFVSPDTTDRPVNYWTVPRWWYYGENTIYESCVRLNNSANNDQIYISTSTLFPYLKVEWNGSSYTFDQDNKREYIDRIWITRDPLLQDGTDYQVPLRGPIKRIGVDIAYIIQNAGTTFTLRSAGTVDYTVDWGDGNSESSTANNLSHTYASTGSYEVKITINSGSYKPNFNDSGDEDQITSIEIGFTDTAKFGTSLVRAFKGAQNMTQYNQVAAATSAVTDLRNTWQLCNSLTTFPLIDTSSTTNFGSAWAYCDELTSFPVLDTSNGTNFALAWRECRKIAAFPALDFSSATNVAQAWRTLPLITEFPSCNFSNVTNFQRSWDNGFQLANYPANQFDTTGTLVSNAFNAAFSNCRLTAQSIENILTSLDTNGQQNITLGIGGGSNAAKTTWSTAANTAYNNLVTKGWTITYNS